MTTKKVKNPPFKPTQKEVGELLLVLKVLIKLRDNKKESFDHNSISKTINQLKQHIVFDYLDKVILI